MEQRVPHTIPKIRDKDQLRRARMHLSCLEQIDNKKVLTPFLKQLLEASLILQTTNITVIAAYLKYSPATIRTGYQRIFTILGERGKQCILLSIKGQTLQCTLH